MMNVYTGANFPVNILVGLEVLKAIYDLSDEELMTHYHFNYLYHKAFGIDDINCYSFSIRTLYYFRKRLEEYTRKTNEDLILKVFADGRV